MNVINKRVALYSRQGGDPCSNDAAGWIEGSDDYVRVTQVVVVEFPELERGEVVREQVEGLEKTRDEMLGKAQAEAARINNKIRELLALPQPEDSDDQQDRL